ncbi:MAG: nitrite/sulfite reductase [Gammaproteobacteria bacterium]|nr:nitrite/sulfite reductase [Gammaproteobacteria bacterium]
MYQYSQTDQHLVDQRVVQFRNQTDRYLNGDLSEDQFRPLRLMNGLYIQRYAPMLRIAIPYGELNSRQLRMLARIARQYDRGYGHITTRQNIQFNWLKLEQVPDLLADLSLVQMHAIQTSGNCIRNITSDHLAGIDAAEIEDPRPWCEIIRQWATLHPEFLYLPRKFKIAVTGSENDRAAILAHDIGLRLVRNPGQETGFQVFVGGGLGRTPVVGKLLHEFLPKHHLLSYLEAILRVYNLHGRRDNKYKARIKILVNSMGIQAFGQAVNDRFQEIRDGKLTLTDDRIEQIRSRFARPVMNVSLPARIHRNPAGAGRTVPDRDAFENWKAQNTLRSKYASFHSVFISLKKENVAPGDISAEEMDVLAGLADRYSGGLVRTTHRQNLLLPLVHADHLYPLWKDLQKSGQSNTNIQTVQDIICCPGLEFCGLANTTSIPIAIEIQNRFTDPLELKSLGDIQIKISGCMNACGHHHIGHIGILGVDKKGEQWFQITLGGRADQNLKLGTRLGPAVSRDHISGCVESVIRQYLKLRSGPDETFPDTFERVGLTPFKEVVYGQ